MKFSPTPLSLQKKMPATGSYWTSIWHLNTNGCIPFWKQETQTLSLNFYSRIRESPFLPEFTIRQAVKEGRLCILTARDFHIQIWRQIVYHRDKWVTREMAEFLRLAKEMATLR